MSVRHDITINLEATPASNHTSSDIEDALYNLFPEGEEFTIESSGLPVKFTVISTEITCDTDEHDDVESGGGWDRKPASEG